MTDRSDLLGKLDSNLLETSVKLASIFKQKGGGLLLVGGTVRDLILNQSPNELDFEARGTSLEEIKVWLAKDFKCDEVGKAFGVLRIKGHPIEIALPRTETKSGTGHKGFEVQIAPNLPFERAVQRRDFTINALGLCPLTGQFFDPCDGISDINSKILRHIGPAFCEDPLRVLRGMQFIARFDLTPQPETTELCKSMNMENLAPERIFEEWKKFILRGIHLSDGLDFLKNTGWVKYFPELSALIGCKQEPEWHPEGDVWVHTLHCMNAFARDRIGDDWEDLIVGLAVICHDLGKPLTTKIDNDGRIRSPMHESRGENPTRSFLSRLTNQVDLHEQVVPLVKRHLTPRTFYKDQASDGAVRRLARKVGRIDRLVRVAAADIAGRPPRKDDFPEGPWLLARAEELQVKDSEPKPIILGRHLIKRGLQPGPEFGPILEQCFEAQLDGVFESEPDGFMFLEDFLSKRE